MILKIKSSIRMSIMERKSAPAILCLAGFIIAIGACAKPAAEEAPAPVVEEPAPVVEVVVEEPEPEPEPIIVEVEPAPVEEVPVRPDSAAYVYMIRPDDYLVKIAQNEHDNRSEWRRIYNRNRDHIGENPNLIYPYHEVQLQKLEDEIARWEYDFSVHVVQSGETLWSIAGNKFGDPIAWIVIFLDNREILGSDAGILEPGMELRIRSALWGDY
jgi:nucleoid-associated protein YgaU